MAYSLEVTDTADAAVHTAIINPLVAFNTAQAGASGGQPVVVRINDDTGQCIGGLSGHTGYGWLFTHLLVVPENLRGQGVGTRVMAQAEAEAKRRGCHAAWLDTFEFQARGFYERLGYTCFGELDDYPKGHRRFFMKKVL